MKNIIILNFYSTYKLTLINPTIEVITLYFTNIEMFYTFELPTKFDDVIFSFLDFIYYNENIFIFSNVNLEKDKKIIIFCIDLTVVFLSIMSRYIKEFFDLKYMITKGTVYSFSLKSLQTDIIYEFRDLSLFLSENFINHIAKNSNFLIDGNIELGDLKKNQKSSLILFKSLIIYNSFIENYSKYWYLNSYSNSSVSKKIFTKCFNIKKIPLSILRVKDDIFRESYYGSRCEVFGNCFSSKEKIFHFDFPNMFGLCMLQKFPIGRVSKVKKPKDISKIGFYKVRVSSSNKFIPVLPHRRDDSNSFNTIVYSNGVFEGFYWHEELKLFVSQGGIIEEIFYGFIWKEEDFIFKDFAQFCIEQRHESPEQKIIFKTILTSFYGRLGMRPVDTFTELIFKDDYENLIKDKEIIKELWGLHYAICEFSLKEENIKKNISSNVIYASIITAKARIKLYNAFLSVERAEGRLLYSDTDSIYAAFKRDVSNEQHGEIRWNQNIKNPIKMAIFANTKAYSIIYNDKREETKISGIPRNSISFNELYQHCLQQGIGHYTVKIRKNYLYAVGKDYESIDYDLYPCSHRVFKDHCTITVPLIRKIVNNKSEYFKDIYGYYY